MNNILIKEIPFNTDIKEKIQIKSSTNTKLNIKDNYVLVNKEMIKSKILF